MKKRHFAYMLWMVFQIILSGCAEENFNRTNIGPENGFTLTFSLAAEANTRAVVPSEEDENIIEKMSIFFFEPSATGDGKFIDIYTVELEDKVLVNGDFRSLVLDFTPSKYTELSAAKDYNLLITANSEEYSLAKDFDDNNVLAEEYDEALRMYFKNLLTGLTENQVLDGTFFRLNKDNLEGSVTTINTDLLPMSGAVSKTGGDSNVEVELTRSVCRIDVINKDMDYELRSATLWNIFPRTTIWGGRYQTYDDEQRVKGQTIKLNNDDDSNKILNQLYTFENYVSDPVQNDELTTCAIVGLLNLRTNDIEYFRINVNSTDVGQQLKRNYLYRVNINKVVGKGKGSEEEAYKDSELLVSGSINDWNLDESNTVLIDGENIMVLPYSRYYFDPQGETINCNIFTHGTGTLEINMDDLPNGMSAVLNEKELTITVGPSDYERQATILVTFGKLKGSITLVQRGDNTEYLEIKPTKLANFPAIPEADKSPSEKIVVTASGIGNENAWDAEIVCTVNGKFSFSATDADQNTENSEVAGDEFQIYVHTPNDGDGPIYGFVMISLRSNPDVNRVLLLTQEAAGGISISPIPSSGVFAFNPEGQKVDATSEDTYTLQITAIGQSPDTPWSYRSVSATDDFDITKSGNELTIKAKGQNTTANELKSTYRVYLDDMHSRFQDFIVSQEAHTITIDPASGFTPIPAAGGQSISLDVESSGAWTATIVQTQHTTVSFGETPSGSAGKTIDAFYVQFPPLTEYGVEPTATIEIRVDGTDVYRTATFRQTSLSTKKLNFYGWGSYGNLATPNSGAHTRHHIAQMSDNIRDLSLFGPSGIVKFPGYTILEQTSNTVPDDADIFQTNYKSIKKLAAGITTWMGQSDKHVYFMCADNTGNADEAFKLLAGTEFISSNFKVASGNTGSAAKRKFNTKNKEKYEALYNYLLKDGPFTKDGNEILDSNIIEIVCCDAVNSRLSAWDEDSFIPIIMTPDGNDCIFGIDPSRRFIYLGDIDIFGNYGSASAANYDGKTPKAIANMKFLNNVIAWMTNAALQGEAFTKQFEIQ